MRLSQFFSYVLTWLTPTGSDHAMESFLALSLLKELGENKSTTNNCLVITLQMKQVVQAHLLPFQSSQLTGRA